MQFDLQQTIDEPTHLTEYSSTLLDIVLTGDADHRIFSGVGDPFLTQTVRYHCPTYGIFNFNKPKRKSFCRHTCSFERGDYDTLREKASLTNWDSFTIQINEITIQAQNISNHIIAIAKECIPNTPCPTLTTVKRFQHRLLRCFRYQI